MIKTNIDILAIQRCMKNRYPFFMLDGITEADTMRYANGYKLFSNNEWFFQGHFSDDPNVPGAIQLETMIETFIMTFLLEPEYQGKQTADSKINELCFYRRIVPGERLDCRAELASLRRGVATGTVSGTVNGERACSCKLTVCIPELMIVPRRNT